MEQSRHFYRPLKEAQQQDPAWHPPADVYRCRDEYLVKVELAGVRSEDIQLSLHGRRLRVEGVRRDWSLQEDFQYHSLEISYSRFVREVELPDALDAAQVTWEYRDGMLLVHVQARGRGK